MNRAGPNELDAPAQPDVGRDGTVLRRRRIGYSIVTAVLALVVLSGVADGLDLVDLYGPDTSVARATGGDHELAVTHASVTRGGLATPLEVEVTRRGGFPGPVTVAVSRSYLDAWDQNGLDPHPESVTTEGPWLLFTFATPPGEVLSVSFDVRSEPGVQSGREGRVAVRDGSRTAVEVRFHTRVLP